MGVGACWGRVAILEQHGRGKRNGDVSAVASYLKRGVGRETKKWSVGIQGRENSRASSGGL